MRHVWTTRDIDAAAERVWEVFTDLDRWPEWGPSITGATADGPLGPGARGRVRTVVGVEVPFVITEWDEGRRWAWRVAGIPATVHTVEPLGDPAAERRSRAGFGVPQVAAPYLAVCRIALGRIAGLAEG